jgi:glycogen operon protein
MDLVSYNWKHNEANGENNNDGSNDNDSWNCGWEGPTDDPGINALRRRQIKNAVAMLLVSQGVPMILMGDELGRTQYGNNNTYCHDNELNWLDWTLLETNADLFRFFKHCIAFRKAHPVLRNRQHFQNRDYVGSGYADISWHGTKAWNADWSNSSHTLAFMLCGKHAKQGTVADNYIYVAMNLHWEAHWFEIPGLPEGKKWHVFVNTGVTSPEDSWEPGTEPLLENQSGILLGDRSVVILVGKKKLSPSKSYLELRSEL